MFKNFSSKLSDLTGSLQSFLSPLHLEDNGRPLSDLIIYVRQNEDWMKNSWTVFEYDSLINRILWTRYLWSNNTWRNFDRWYYKFTGSVLDSSVYQSWSAMWENKEKYIYDYDSTGNLNTRVFQNWNNNWENDARLKYKYFPDDNLESDTLQIWESTNQWSSRFYTDYRYSINNLLVEELTRKWNGVNWDVASKTIYTYDQYGNRIERISQQFINGDWVNTTRDSTIYENNLIKEFINQVWENEWIFLFKSVYSYNIYYEITEILVNSWQSNNWTPSLKYNFFYVPITEIKHEPYSRFSFLLNQNYPNPFNPSTVIRYQVPEAGFVTLKVYDILGKEVATLVNEEKIAGSYEVEFYPESGIRKLGSGIYFYQLKAGDFIETKKMILLR
ncbi:MAG TPA: T9SS type A sorting domain-containing protein [Ignavibacteriaceae bacterium]|nr:T9SS type A sorting domain-containing protein [Ignavibacteriaceae bacterium]